MAAPIALIQGASRGLGLAFCKHILKNNQFASVIATCRNPDGADELRGLIGQHPARLTMLKLNVNQEDDIRGAAEQVKEAFGRLDLLVNSSAMLHPSGKGETSLRDVSAQGIVSTLTTNTVGPLVMAKYFSPLLQKGAGGFGQQPSEKAKQHSGIIVNITAKVGSIGDNGLGGWYSYRMSKAALNMATRNLSIELGRSRPKYGGAPSHALDPYISPSKSAFLCLHLSVCTQGQRPLKSTPCGTNMWFACLYIQVP
ncbi:uncharacterized protein LOC101175020 isoform X2 [Oryzias latipes]|uniref:uncharacterized protein LOC101175020 isoform X2 n=1 Tax=Oryzias latipes TaxID=8090 RepID=UPI0005CB954E|nr:uncharacterized protein LOC101175020 isoform X2 [Oryzias latipes]